MKLIEKLKDFNNKDVLISGVREGVQFNLAGRVQTDADLGLVLFTPRGKHKGQILGIDQRSGKPMHHMEVVPESITIVPDHLDMLDVLRITVMSETVDEAENILDGGTSGVMGVRINPKVKL